MWRVCVGRSRVFIPRPVLFARPSRSSRCFSTPVSVNDRPHYFKQAGFIHFNEAEMRLAHARLLATKDPLALRVLQCANAEELADFSTFKARVFAVADKLDPRIKVLASSFFVTGLSIGVIVPILPILVSQIQLTPSEFSVVVSSFAVAKLIGGIPSASYAETHGRKNIIVAGTAICGVGIGSIGVTLLPFLSVQPAMALSWLVLARCFTGFGHAFFTSGALMYVADISNSRNRTRSLAPISMAMHAGLMLGPVIGGLLVESIGITKTYFTVGAGVCGIALLNRSLLPDSYSFIEPKEPLASGATSSPPPQGGAHGFKAAFGSALVSWRELVKNGSVRDTLFLNASYWITLAGTQFTLLPLHMVALELGPTQIGMCFAGMSVVTVVVGQPFAWLADRVGKLPMLAVGSSLLMSSMMFIPKADSFESLLISLVPMALGSTILSAVPVSFISDIVGPVYRSQAISLLRTIGDVGFLIGAAFSGIMCQLTSIGTTMQSNASFIAAGILMFFIRQYKKK